MGFQKTAVLAILSSAAALTAACSSGGGIIDNNAQLTSSGAFEFTGGDTPIAWMARLEPTATACAPDATACTPVGFGGRVFAASAMLGEKSRGGLGEGAFAMTFLADRDEVIQNPSVGQGGTLAFDLAMASVFSGRIQIPPESEMPAEPYMPRLEIAFDHLDTRVSLEGTSNAELAKEWVVRTIFVRSDLMDGVAVTGGDLLLSGDDGATWKWCDVSGCSSTRPETPYQLSSIVNALDTAAERAGNPNYAYYSTDFPTGVDTSYDVIADPSRLWTIDFDLGGAVKWLRAPVEFGSEADILANFKLSYGCSYAGCEPDSDAVKASLGIGEPGSVDAALVPSDGVEDESDEAVIGDSETADP